MESGVIILQADSDGDNIGDACVVDTDGDSIPDSQVCPIKYILHFVKQKFAFFVRGISLSLYLWLP